MIGVLYRYSHPYDAEKFIYVGQGKNRDKQHRSSRTSFGRRFKSLFPDAELPQPIKEQVDVKDGLDLNELETIWMFQYHTWWGYGGMNLTFPGAHDYKTLGRLQGRKNVENGHWRRIQSFENCSKGGQIGGRKRVELHGPPGTRESCAEGGRIAGPINGRKAVESGQLASIQTPENRRKAGEANIKSGHMAAVGKSGKGLCFRWRIKQNKSCVCGKHEAL